MVRKPGKRSGLYLVLRSREGVGGSGVPIIQPVLRCIYSLVGEPIEYRPEATFMRHMYRRNPSVRPLRVRVENNGIRVHTVNRSTRGGQWQVTLLYVKDGGYLC